MSKNISFLIFLIILKKKLINFKFFILIKKFEKKNYLKKFKNSSIISWFAVLGQHKE